MDKQDMVHVNQRAEMVLRIEYFMEEQQLRAEALALIDGQC